MNRVGALKIAESEGTAKPLTSVGTGAQWQFPSYSPSGNHRAFVEDLGINEQPIPAVNGVIPLQTFHRALWVDGARIVSHTNIVRYSWMNDDMIAFSADDSLFVVTIDGGMLMRQGFSVAKRN
jgi:hypothetical protein